MPPRIVTLDDIRNNRGGNGRNDGRAPAAALMSLISTIVLVVPCVWLFWRIFKLTVTECGCTNTVEGFVMLVGNVAENCGTLWGSGICTMACAANGNERRTGFYQHCVHLNVKAAVPDGQPVCTPEECPVQHVLHVVSHALYDTLVNGTQV